MRKHTVSLLDYDKTILIYGSITTSLSESVYRQMKRQEKDKSCEFIYMKLRTTGGFSESGHFLHDEMVDCKKPIIIYAQGQASSTGLLILCAGGLGNRFVAPYSSSINHAPYTWEEGDADKDEPEVVSFYNRLENRSRKLASFYQNQCDNEDKRYVIKPRELIKFGLADTIGKPVAVVIDHDSMEVQYSGRW